MYNRGWLFLLVCIPGCVSLYIWKNINFFAVIVVGRLMCRFCIFCIVSFYNWGIEFCVSPKHSMLPFRVWNLWVRINVLFWNNDDQVSIEDALSEQPVVHNVQWGDIKLVATSDPLLKLSHIYKLQNSAIYIED
jgi:hypothetical protein